MLAIALVDALASSVVVVLFHKEKDDTVRCKSAKDHLRKRLTWKCGVQASTVDPSTNKFSDGRSHTPTDSSNFSKLDTWLIQMDAFSTSTTMNDERSFLTNLPPFVPPRFKDPRVVMTYVPSPPVHVCIPTCLPIR